MDKELIFYIIFGLIYLISRATKKKKQKQKQAQTQAPPPQSQQRPASQTTPTATPVSQGPAEEEPESPMSFEEILRELSGEGRKKREQAPPAPAPAPEPEPEPEYYKPPKPVKNAPEVLDPKTGLPEYAFTSQDQNISDASDLWSAYKTDTPERVPSRKSIHDEIKEEKEREGMGFKIYDQLETENAIAVNIREMLEDKEDIKTAIVLAEVLKRRF